VNGNAETVAHISPLAPADVDELAVLAAAIWRHIIRTSSVRRR
jgi:hypothetical protein